MTLLEDIQTAAIDSKSDLATLLRKCKLLAARLESQPLEDWVLWESNGYPDNVGVPHYRVWPLEVKGNFAGPFGASIRNASVPLGCIPEKSRRYFEGHECRQSIASVEAILTKYTGGTLVVLTSNLAVLLGTKVYQHYNCLHAWAEFGESNLVELLNTVRNRILDFSLAVWKEAPNAGEPEGYESQKIEAGKVTQIFYTTVYGGTTSLVGTANDSVVKFDVRSKDFSSLESTLRSHGVSKAELTDLRTAVDADGELRPGRKFGPKVSCWVGKMTGKAADGSWNIGLQAAGTLLAQAIMKYYGL